MKILKYAVAAVVVILLIGALIAPIGPVPGFIIGGNATAAPAQWPDTSELHEIKLKAGGFPPRVVIIWVIEHDDELWVAGGSDSGWVTRLAADGNAELRIEDNTYPVQAVAIKEPAVWQPVLAAYIAKYQPDYPEIIAGFPSGENLADQISVFRLDR